MVNVKSGRIKGKKRRGEFIQNGADIIRNIYLNENTTDSILNDKRGLCPFRAVPPRPPLHPSLHPAFFLFQFQAVTHSFALFLRRCPTIDFQTNRFPSVFSSPSAPPSLPPSPPTLPPSAYNRRRLPSQGAGNGVQVQEGVIMMSLHKHGAARGCLDEASGGDASGKLPRPSWERSFATQRSKNGGETKNIGALGRAKLPARRRRRRDGEREDEKAACLPVCPSVCLSVCLQAGRSVLCLLPLTDVPSSWLRPP